MDSNDREKNTVRKYLVNDETFNKINNKFVTLEKENVKQTNEHLNKIINKLIEKMKEQNSLFNKTFQKIAWTGSFYKKTKVGLPDEFDLNLIIQLPIKKDDMKLSTDLNLPGYIKIHTKIYENNNLNMDAKAYSDMMGFIDQDQDQYLDQEKFRRWIESILNKVAFTTNGNNDIKIDDYIIKVSKSGPAFTLSFQDVLSYPINVDLVPVLAFKSRDFPRQCSIYQTLQDSDKDIFLVPKPLSNKNIFYANSRPSHYWRLSFYIFEKDMLSKYGRAKPIIRQLKKFRETQNWKSIASYYIETLCFHHLERFETRESNTSLLFTMLENLHEAFEISCIKHYWDKNINLLENIEKDEMMNMKGRLYNIIRNIRKQIIEQPDNLNIIAGYVLNSAELKELIHPTYEAKSNLEQEPESQQETVGSWNCIII
ncbi:cyclic GMP-AMP synthase-like [Harpegnathos saltator]|uniref:cyclic GMP-AMP synthase-like n=1 Tax=Harpegnathos saltator TaxID=610380 RepID=UPI000DBED0F8|nr:cyclic GMP-AMP synthase-like [Harpegnathos saltator]